MPIYDETWEQVEFAPRAYWQLRDLPKNHLGKLALLKFEFVEYKANQQLACHLYERMMLHCFNQFGVIEAQKKQECRDSVHFFDQCLQINNYFAALQKHSPEYFMSSAYSRHNNHFSELGL